MMKKKIGLTMEESVHKQMKKIALEHDVSVYAIYEQLAIEFIESDNKEKTLNEIRKKIKQK